MDSTKLLLSIFLLTCTTLSVHAGKLDNLFKDHTTIEKPFELRDPFQSPKFQSETTKKNKEKSSGVMDNQVRLDGEVNLSEVKIVGVLIGKERRVVIKVQEKGPYTLREGEKLGFNGPEIKAIMAGGIILVEQITNIYGEAEYIETIIPISN